MSAGRCRCRIWAEELAALRTSRKSGRSGRPQATRSYLFLRAASIYGGTNEIQKNILSKARAGAVTTIVVTPANAGSPGRLTGARLLGFPLSRE